MQADLLAMFCRQCSYPLTHLTGAACPECGRPFDPADPATFLTRPRPRLTRLPMIAMRWLLARFPITIRLSILSVVIAGAWIASNAAPPFVRAFIQTEVHTGFLIFGLSLVAALGITYTQRTDLKSRALLTPCLGFDLTSLTLWTTANLLLHAA